MSGFDVIYADPPWQYTDKGVRGSATGHYPTLTPAMIAALPVHRLAAKDCALFMWGTYPLLPDVLRTIEGWGFAFKSIAFQWVKTYPKAGTPVLGLGRWTRGNTEPCFLATRGKPKRVDAGVSQLILDGIDEEVLIAPMGRHSAKPDLVRERIDQLMGPGKKIELFARKRADGWFSTGFDLDGLDVRDVLERIPH